MLIAWVIVVGWFWEILSISDNYDSSRNEQQTKDTSETEGDERDVL